jgi:hypothetical protein
MPRLPACEHPLPKSMPTCMLIRDFLSREECAALIADAERKGFDGASGNYPPSYRDNDRQVNDDANQAEAWFERMRGLVPGRVWLAAEEGQGSEEWELAGLNERIRTCRYRAGQRFNIHQDGVHHRGRDCRSLLTFMIYLTDGSEFEGGDTLFFAQGPRASVDGTHLEEPIARVRPRAGSLIVFDHRLWHSGETVTAGVKHIVRSDLIYRKVQPTSCSRPRAWMGHEGYVWTMARLGSGLIASGGRDGAIRIWNDRGALLSTLRGHAQSVFGIVEIAPGKLASVSRDKTLRLWDVARGECTRSIEAHQSAILALAKIDADTIATGGADGEIAFWTLLGSLRRRIKAHEGWVWALASLSGKYLASAGEDGAVSVWHAETGGLVARLRTNVPLRSIDAIQARDDSWRIAAGDIAGRVSVFRFDGDKLELQSRADSHDAAVRSVRWFSFAELASCGEDGQFLVSRWESRVCTFRHRAAYFATDLIALPDGRLLGCGYDGEIVEHRNTKQATALAA